MEAFMGVIVGPLIVSDVCGEAKALGAFVRRCRWPPSSVNAIAICSTILVSPTTRVSRRLIAHECEHVRQWRSVRWLLPRYLMALVRYGYTRNPYEVAASEAERARSRPCDMPIEHPDVGTRYLFRCQCGEH